jgi:hypothetical protein
VKFISDHSLAPNLSEILAILEGPAGHAIEHLRRFYPQDTEDAVWLPRLAQDLPDVVIVTADPRIARSPQEPAAWLQSGLTAFFFKSFADLSRWEQAWRVVKWWPSIVERAQAARRGTGFMVSVNGRIDQAR